MNSTIHFSVLLLFSFTLGACQENDRSVVKAVADAPYTEKQFNDYWYAGKAEVVAYNLKQSRYGEIHNGKAVLIFVTEPFSYGKQVKLDNPDEAGEDKITVMKLNFTKKFTTGIYPYSMMLSTFTPVDAYHYPNTLKITMSSQEWCGHVFTQMNLKKRQYHVQSFSYFESEGDRELTIKPDYLEDEIWNKIRLNYRSLPTGDIHIVPGLLFTRMKHQDLQPEQASAILKEETDTATYTINYPERTLSITFTTSFPYKILSWEETYKGIGGKILTTSATLDKMLYIDYWNKNKTAFSYLRDSLNLK